MGPAVRWPNTPDDRDRTVDTANYFTWLPGERTTRFDFDAYQGEVEDWQGRDPAYKNNSGLPRNLPGGYPLKKLDVVTKTEFVKPDGSRGLWKKLPNDAYGRAH